MYHINYINEQCTLSLNSNFLPFLKIMNNNCDTCMYYVAMPKLLIHCLFLSTGGFKGESKVKYAKKWREEEAIREQEPEQQVESTILFAIGSHKVFVTFCLFLHGLTAGIAMWHLTMTYILLYFSYIDFLEHYRILALPVQCMFYILLVLCTVSACDR